MKKLIFSLLILAGTPAIMLAHEGHGVHPSSNALHYILEWVHGAPIFFLAIAVAVTGIIYAVKTSRARKRT